MAVDVTQVEQAHPGAELINGKDRADAKGVLAPLYEDADVLKYQAMKVAQLRRNASIYTTGESLPENFVKRVAASAKRGVVGLNEATINALQKGDLTRDQAYVGSNAQWTGYYLEPEAKFIVPLDTPVRNILPRIGTVGIDIINWRAITDTFGGNGPSVGAFILQQQGTPQELLYNWVNQSNVLKMLAARDLVTFESELYGRMFEPDVRAMVASKLIPMLMLGQETWYLNAAQCLWNPPPAIATASTASGSVTGSPTTYWFLVTAVNANGETLASTLTGGVYPSATLSTTGNIALTIFRVPNAVKYNVYVGSGSTQPATSAMWLQGAAAQFGGASALNDPTSLGVSQGYFIATMTANPVTSGTAYSAAVTTIAAATPSGQINSAVAFKSTDSNTLGQPLTFDGIQALLYKATGTLSTLGVGGLTSLVQYVGGPLTQTAIDSALKTANLNARANPELMLVSIQDSTAVTKIVTNATAFRITQSIGAGQGSMTAGFRAVEYINPVTGRLIQILMCPYLPQGTIIFASLTLPFPVAQITKPIWRIEYNREMWAVEYPPDQSHMTQWQYAAYDNETMVNQFLGGFILLNGITIS